MKTGLENIKYDFYARKSSEAKERQALSIEGQMKWKDEICSRMGIKIQESFYEEKSAEAPYNRPVFDKLVTRIRSKQTNGIIAWKLDRIARNPEEAGVIIGMLKRGELHRIITNDREYRTEDNAILSYIDFGMADQYSRDLSKNVKRGHWTKASNKGCRSGYQPTGYMNKPGIQKGQAYPINDPERFDLVKRIFDLFLKGEYSVRQLQKLTAKWGLKTRQTKSQGGKYLSIAQIYRILTNVFYAGYFWATHYETGEKVFIKGVHEPMISLDQFDLIQVKLGRKGKPRARTHFFPFTGKMQCGECGGMITAEEKYQIICPECKYKFAALNKTACPKCNIKIEEMSKPTILHYTYYRCSKNKRTEHKCTQKTMRVENLEALIDQALLNFNVSKAFTDWALEELAKENDQEIKSQNDVINSQQNEYKKVVDRLQNLVRLYTSPENASGELLSLDEYAPQRKALIEEKNRLEKDQQATGERIEEWIDWAENSFNFATAARLWFEIGTPEQKKEIFYSLSRSNLTLKDGILFISLKNPLDLYAAIVKKYPAVQTPFEPKNDGSNKQKYLPFAADIPTLRRG